MQTVADCAQALGQTLTKINDYDVILVTRFGKPIYRCVVIPAEEVVVAPFDRCDRNLVRLQRSIFDELLELDSDSGYTGPRLPFVMYLLGSAEFFAVPEHDRVVATMDRDERTCLKRHGTIAGLATLLSPYFPIEAATAPAKACKVTTHSGSENPFLKGAPTPTHVLHNYECARVMECTLTTARQKERLISLFERINGPNRPLVLHDDGPMLAWSQANRAEGLPLPYCGQAERTMFGLLHSLVALYDEVSEGDVVLLDCVLNPFDTLNQTMLMDLLLDFTLATKTHLYLIAPKSETRAWLRRKFSMVLDKWNVMERNQLEKQN